jgi:hypothetical protein
MVQIARTVERQGTAKRNTTPGAKKGAAQTKLRFQTKLRLRHPEVQQALDQLAAEGKATGARSTKISARVDPGIFAAAAARLGLAEGDVSDVVNASLAVAAAPDRFKAWLRNSAGTLPDDFELAI